MNIYLVNILTAVICLLAGYLIGGIPTGVWIGKIFFHKDIRDYGSHNSGGTNAGRVLGKKIGFLVIVLDMVKTVGCVYACWAIVTFTTLHQYYVFDNGSYIFSDISSLYYWMTALAASFGHCFPIYLKFKGGKAAASLMGMATLSSWAGFAVGFMYLGALKIKKMVSLASILGGAAQVLFAWIVFIIEATVHFHSGFFSWTFACGDSAMRLGLWYAIAITAIFALLVIRHSANIKRMREGTESKITWMK